MIEPVTERWDGGRISDRVTCVLERNPGPMTLDGTNTYVLGEPGARRVVVVDPGEDDAAHRRAVLEVATAGGRTVGLVLLTHHHRDHASGAARLAAETGAPVRAVDPALCVDAPPLGAERIEVDGLVVESMPTPGHTTDSVCFVLPDEGALLTGDTVLGRGTTVLGPYDGSLGDYLTSLRRLQDRVHGDPLGWLLPGHGAVSADAARVVDTYRAHREERLEQVRVAVRAGAATADEVVAVVYADVDPSVLRAAAQSVRAQLDHLARTEGLDLGRSGPPGRPAGG